MSAEGRAELGEGGGAPLAVAELRDLLGVRGGVRVGVRVGVSQG